jgi:DNA-binding MarR family transcriptional regulator
MRHDIPNTRNRTLDLRRAPFLVSSGMNPKRDLLSGIVTLARLIRTEADKRARAHGMTRAQWTILIRLEEQPGLLQKELAELLEVEPITVARLIDRHEARGMVERRPDPSDRRCWRLHLTEAARPLLGEIDIQLTEMAESLCQGLDEATLAKVASALLLMRERAQEQRGASLQDAADGDAGCLPTEDLVA